MSTINSTILSIMRRRHVKGLTVGEIDDLFQKRWPGMVLPLYSSVRARVYELVKSGKLQPAGVRKDSTTNRDAMTFTRPQ